ncbi:hypothetical protein ACHQM5_021096 [Ranunculus cassubicifolius]
MEEHAPGFRFYPTEAELVSFYLHRKLQGTRDDDFQRIIPVIDIYEFDPWQLPQISGKLCHGDPEQWFFFCPRQEREARGGRPTRITSSGYWKATGSPGFVFANNRNIAVKKTMVFYQGKAPTGRKTKWKMIEYKAIEDEATSSITSTPPLRHEFSVCRVYINSGCLRVFDRRPSGPERQESVDQQGEVVVTSSYQSPIIHENVSSSFESVTLLENESDMPHPLWGELEQWNWA